MTLWFETGDKSKWNASALTYTDGANSVKVSGVAADKVTLCFGESGAFGGRDYAALAVSGAFSEISTAKIVEGTKSLGVLATL